MALQLETVVCATVVIQLSCHVMKHQEMARLLLGILSLRAEVALVFRLRDATDAAGWTVLATTLAQLNVSNVFAHEGIPLPY